MCRRFEPNRSQEQGICDEDHGCGRNMHERQKRCDWRRKMIIKNETEVTSRGSRRNRVTVSEKKSMTVDYV